MLEQMLYPAIGSDRRAGVAVGDDLFHAGPIEVDWLGFDLPWYSANSASHAVQITGLRNKHTVP